jgi:hypothetical protein
MTIREELIRVGEHDVKITRPDKILFPKGRITKQELIEYYRRIAPGYCRISGAGRWPWSLPGPGCVLKPFRWERGKEKK